MGGNEEPSHVGLPFVRRHRARMRAELFGKRHPCPRYRALEREARVLDKEGITQFITRLRHPEQIAQSQDCGAVEKFFAPYLQ